MELTDDFVFESKITCVSINLDLDPVVPEKFGVCWIKFSISAGVCVWSPENKLFVPANNPISLKVIVFGVIGLNDNGGSEKSRITSTIISGQTSDLLFSSSLTMADRLSSSDQLLLFLQTYLLPESSPALMHRMHPDKHVLFLIVHIR